MESGADSTTHCAQTEGEFKKKQQHNIIVVIIVFLWTEQSSVCFFPYVYVQKEYLSLDSWSCPRVRD